MSALQYIELGKAAKSEYEKLAKGVTFALYGTDRVVAEVHFFGRNPPEVALCSKTVLCVEQGALNLSDLTFTIKGVAAFGHFIAQMIYWYFKQEATIVDFVDKVYADNLIMYNCIDENLKVYDETGNPMVKPTEFVKRIKGCINGIYNDSICKGNEHLKVVINSPDDYTRLLKVLRVCTHHHLYLAVAKLADEKPVNASPFDFEHGHMAMFCSIPAQQAKALCDLAAICIKKGTPTPKKGGKDAPKKGKTAEPKEITSAPPKFDDDAPAAAVPTSEEVW